MALGYWTSRPHPAASQETFIPPPETALPPSAVGDWPCLFGPAHDSISRETGIITSWPDSGPTEKWRRSLGTGYSVPVVAEGHLIVFHRQGDEEIIQSLDPATGEPQWRFAYATAFQCRFRYSSGPYSTPAIDEGHVYAWGAEGKLHCLQLDDGGLVWRRSLREEFDATELLFAVGASPLVWQDRLILNVGGRRNDNVGDDRKASAGIVALDKQTGRTLWTATDHGASYATPRAATIHGRDYLFVLTDAGLVSLDPRDGRVHWEIPFQSKHREAVNATSPLVYGDRVMISAYMLGSLCLKVTADGNYEEVWRQRRGLDSHYNNLVAIGGRVYGFSARDRTASLWCIDLATGKSLWKLPSEFGRGMSLAIDGQLLLLGEYGHLGSMPLGGERPALTCMTPEPLLDGPCYTQPILSRGLLYLRNESTLVCYNLRR
jgi:outer membrane protein assembly factor BamB